MATIQLINISKKAISKKMKFHLHYKQRELERYLKGSLQYWNILPVLEKMMRTICASQRTKSSWVFLIRSILRLENVTCLVVVFWILLISIFPRPISKAASSSLYPFLFTSWRKKDKYKRKLYIPFYFSCYVMTLKLNR